MSSASFFFFFSCYGDHRDLHSFPTRRSSDLESLVEGGKYAVVGCYGLLCGFCWCCLPHGLFRFAFSCVRSEEHTSELQSHSDLVCRLLLEKKKNQNFK